MQAEMKTPPPGVESGVVDNDLAGGEIETTIRPRPIELQASLAEANSFECYVLAELRCAVARHRLEVLDMTAIGLALKANMLSPEDALIELHNRGCLHLVGANTANGHAQTCRKQ